MSRPTYHCLLLALSIGLSGCSVDGSGTVPGVAADASSPSVAQGAGPGAAPSAGAAVTRADDSRPLGGGTGRDAAANGGVDRPPDAGAVLPRDGGVQSDPHDAATTAPSGDVWKPKPGTRWQWDLSGEVSKLDVAADVYDIDGFETDAALVAQLHAMGKKAICYLSVGTSEPGRPDAKDFPKAALGKYWPEWEETYIDIRSEAVRTIMKKRLDMCKSKGFDGVEPDNMDMFEGGMSDTGFPLTEADGIAYAKWLASEVHARGMSIGQKNASSITSAIESLYDWGLTEDCFADGWCNEMKSYPDAGKALFMCEYTDTKVDFKAACAAAKQSNFSAILKKRELDAWVQYCE
jgi:hypothetical protein